MVNVLSASFYECKSLFLCSARKVWLLMRYVDAVNQLISLDEGRRYCSLSYRIAKYIYRGEEGNRPCRQIKSLNRGDSVNFTSTRR